MFGFYSNTIHRAMVGRTLSNRRDGPGPPWWSRGSPRAPWVGCEWWSCNYQAGGQEGRVISLIISLYREQLSKTLPPAGPDIGHLASFLVEYVNGLAEYWFWLIRFKLLYLIEYRMLLHQRFRIIYFLRTIEEGV